MPEHEMPDISATLSASFDAAESGDDYVAPVIESTEPAGDEVQTEVKQELDQSDDQPTDQPDDSPASLDPPERWSADDKATFAALPPEAQSLVLKREGDVESHLSKRTQELSDQGKQYAALNEVIEPRRQSLIVDYGSEAAGLNTLFALSDMATKDPAGFIQYFAQQRGIDLESLQSTTDESVDPEINALRQELSQLRGTLTQTQQAEQHKHQGQLVQQVEAFSQEKDTEGELAHPHFESVREHMAALFNVNPDLTLKDAYEQSVWANPETRKGLQEAQTKTQEAQRLTQAKAKAAAAEKAASTRPRASNGQFVEAKGTIEDTMTAVYDSMTA
jgi:hypothetical protein